MTEESRIRAEVSLYPLRRTSLRAPVEAAIEVFEAAGLDPVVRTMSTELVGPCPVVFAALERAFEAASEGGDVVLSVHVSNACHE